MIHLGAAHSSAPAEPAMDVSAELPAEPPAGLSAGPPVEPVAAVVRAAPSPSSPAPGLETPRDQPRALAIRDPRSPSPSSSPSLAVGSPRARPDAPTPSASDDLQRQNQQLREARSALRQGDAARALELASAYERSFPGGLFGPEFALTRVRALCAQGRVTQAHTEATLLRHRFPDSAVIAAAEPGCPRAHDPAPSR